MTTCNKSEFAKLINRAPSYVTELIKHGRIVLTDDGKRVQVAASLQLMDETASGASPQVAARHEAIRQSGKKPRKVKAVTEGSRQYYEQNLQSLKNQHKQLDYELAIKKRFFLADAKNEAHGIGNTLRSSIEKLIDLAAPRLAALTDKNQRAQLLQVEIKQLARVIKAEFPRAMRRLRKG